MAKNKLNFALTALLQILVTAVTISLAYVLMVVVQSMEQKDTAMFFQSLIYIGIIMVSFLLFSTLLKTIKNNYIKKALAQFKKYIFKKILDKSVGEFSGELSGKIISLFSNDLNSIELNYLSGTIMIISYIFMFIVTIAAMALINVTIMLCVLGICIIPVLASLVFGKKLMKKEKETSIENEGFIEQIRDLLGGFYVIKSFKAEKEVINLFGNQNFILEEAKRGRRDANDIMTMTAQLSSVLVLVVILILGIIFIFQETMTIATVIACIQLSNHVVDPTKFLLPLITNRRAASVLINKIADVVEYHEDTGEKTKISRIDNSIKLSELTVKYEKDKVALKNVNLEFKKGKSYALVGGSGSGKSTLLKLLMGYFNDYQGTAKYDDNEIIDIDLDSLYDVVAVVQQNVFLFDKSIKDNITMFKEFTEEEIDQAVLVSGLSSLISEKGMEYTCGENGCNLSGGEKQRVSIARCLIKGTPVLLMDEATASLDNATAFQVENDILDMDMLTRIIVTHRLQEQLLNKYDEIIVLKDGALEEQGGFDNLMNAKGYFYSLYNVANANANANDNAHLAKEVK